MVNNMASTKNKLKCVAYSTGLGAFSAVCSATLTAAMLAAMGLVAHGAGYVINWNAREYSLKNRFETAYSFKTPESHKHYYLNNGQSTEYIMTPYGMYGIIGTFAALSAAFGAMTGRLIAKDKEEEELKKQRQKIR